MRGSWRWRAVAVGSVAVLGLGACGGDDDDDAGAEEPTEQSGGTDVAAFCDAIDGVGLEVSLGEGYERVDGALVAAEEIAPAAVKDAVTVMAEESRSQVAAGPPPTGTPPELPPDEYFTAAVAVGDYMADHCGYQVIDVTATEYALDGIPAEAQRGKTLIRVTNDGSEYHHVVVQVVRYGETRSIEEILALPEGGDLLDYQASAFAPPGLGSWAVVDLSVGRHAWMCPVPTGATSVEAMRSAEADSTSEPHDTKGETAEMQIP